MFVLSSKVPDDASLRKVINAQAIGPFHVPFIFHIQRDEWNVNSKWMYMYINHNHDVNSELWQVWFTAWVLKGIDCVYSH